MSDNRLHPAVEPTKGTLVRWADGAMYKAEEMPFDVNETGPRVTLLNATPQPLGAIAAMAMMYEGKVVRDLADVTEEQRRSYFADINRTKLKAPFESVSLHFMIEGVTRSFTHQMVRQRTAVFAQESLRFAVKEDFSSEVALPPSIAGTEPSGNLGAENTPEEYQRNLWEEAVANLNETYNHLVDSGMPAEDARGLLPHNITTRLHYVTNLRALQDHGGNRLCTQAQFEWRAVWDQIIRAIADYGTDYPFGANSAGRTDNWEFQQIASIFRPVCYLTGKCEFEATFDRSCKIKSRVTANAKIGRPSSEWHKGYAGKGLMDFEGQDAEGIAAIHPAEWMLDPTAAR